MGDSVPSEHSRHSSASVNNEVFVNFADDSEIDDSKVNNVECGIREEDVDKKRTIAREKAKMTAAGISNPITSTSTDGKVENGRYTKPVDRSNVKMIDLDEKPFEKYLKYAYLIIALSIVIGLFLLPIVFFFTDQPGSISIGTSLPIDLKKCESLVQPSNATFVEAGHCALNIMGSCLQYPSQCFCEDVLKRRASSKNATEQSVHLESQMIEGFKDIIFRSTDEILNTSLTTPECKDDFLSLLCAHHYRPCTADNDSALLLPSADECRAVRDDKCIIEWRLLERLNNVTVPNCGTIANASLATERTPDIQCHSQFATFCDSFCLPLCDSFLLNSDGITLLQDVLFIFAAISSLIGGAVVIIISIYRRDSMFRFPSILIIYQTICVMTISFFVMLPFPAGRGNLFCSARSLIDAYENPTVYCQISGIVIHACILMMHFFWIMHLLHMFTRLAFPMRARSFDHSTYRHWVHIGEVGGAIIVSVVPPIIIVLASEYNVPTFPPNYCVPTPTIAYYTELLPINFILALGVCFIIVIFWMLHQRDEIFKASTAAKKGKCNFLELTTPEFKLLLLFSYYVLFGVLFLTTSTLIVRNYDDIIDEIEAYALCQSRGNNPACEDLRSKLDKLNYPGLLNTCYILMAILNITNLIFVLQFRDIKYQVKKLSVVARRLTIDRLNSTSLSN